MQIERMKDCKKIQETDGGNNNCKFQTYTGSHD